MPFFKKEKKVSAPTAPALSSSVRSDIAKDGAKMYSRHQQSSCHNTDEAIDTYSKEKAYKECDTKYKGEQAELCKLGVDTAKGVIPSCSGYPALAPVPKKPSKEKEEKEED
jgi:hypothetical protein